MQSTARARAAREGVIVDPRQLSRGELERLTRRFASEIERWGALIREAGVKLQ